MIEAKKIESRKREIYGDFSQVWSIKTDEEKEKVRDYCFSEFCKGLPPTHSELLRAILANYYIFWYYKLEE